MPAGHPLLPEARRADPSDNYAGVDVHPPKAETFDLANGTNTDPKGNVRAVDEYRVEPFGLYVAREVVGHPSMGYLESWLLPSLDLRVTDFYFRPGYERDQDFYLDIGPIRPGPDVWTSADHYLDIVVRTGRGLDVLDTDELLGAVDAELLAPRAAQHALETTYRTVAGIAAHGYDVAAWLAEQGIRVSWRRR